MNQLNVVSASQPLKATAPMPTRVFLILSADRALLGATVRALGPTGDKVASGFVNSVRVRNGHRYVAVRLISNGQVYVGSVNWDATRFCKIELAPQNLEVVL